MLNKANLDDHQLKTYTTLAQIGLSVGDETFDGIASALPDNATLTYSVNISQNADIYPALYGVCTITKVSVARVFFEFASENGGKRWVGSYYHSANPTFAGWTPLATATPPQEYDLPLAAGIVANNPCFYFKTQEGIVHGFMRFSSASPISPSTKLAILPPGYRTYSYLEILLSTAQNSIGIHTNGNIIMYGAAVPANQVCFFSFPPFVGH